MSSNRTLKFDGDWMDVGMQKYLYSHGYAASVIRDGGVRYYCLHRVENSLRHPIIHMTKDLDELNNMIKLLVPEN